MRYEIMPQQKEKKKFIVTGKTSLIIGLTHSGVGLKITTTVTKKEMPVLVILCKFTFIRGTAIQLIP